MAGETFGGGRGRPTAHVNFLDARCHGRDMTRIDEIAMTDRRQVAHRSAAHGYILTPPSRRLEAPPVGEACKLGAPGAFNIDVVVRLD